MAFRMKCNAAKLSGQLGNVGQALRSDFSKRYLPVASGLIAREQNRHFTSQSAPDGTPWKPLSDLTLALSKGEAKQKTLDYAQSPYALARQAQNGGKRGRQKKATVRRTDKSKILMDTGALRASVSVDGATGAIREITPSKLRFGTNMRQAALQQFGGTLDVTDKMRGAIYGKTGVWIVAETLTIPARPFLGTSDQCKGELVKAARYVLQQTVKAIK